MIDKRLLDKLSALLVERGETVAVAESVTAGLIQQSLAVAENATDFFQGGITAYNIKQKVKQLNINRAHAKACNCVSQKVAVQMARGVAKVFGSGWSIAVTGYASPVPELNIRKLYAYYAIVYKNELIDNGCIEAEHKRPVNVQEEYVGEIIKNFTAAVATNRMKI